MPARCGSALGIGRRPRRPARVPCGRGVHVLHRVWVVVVVGLVEAVLWLQGEGGEVTVTPLLRPIVLHPPGVRLLLAERRRRWGRGKGRKPWLHRRHVCVVSVCYAALCHGGGKRGVSAGNGNNGAHAWVGEFSIVSTDQALLYIFGESSVWGILGRLPPLALDSVRQSRWLFRQGHSRGG